jgi:hypothetical protein
VWAQGLSVCVGHVCSGMGRMDRAEPQSNPNVLFPCAVLDLSANMLWGTAPLALARAIASGGSPALLSLNLSNNFISSEGAAEIARYVGVWN